MTPNSWLNVYLQLNNADRNDENTEDKPDHSFVFPKYSSHAFIQIARVCSFAVGLILANILFLQLLDLCTLDISCLQFPYSILTTSALYHMSSDQIALSVSGMQLEVVSHALSFKLLLFAGYNWTDIAACVQWMAPFATTLRESGSVELKSFSQVPPEASHNIQSHVVDLSMLVSTIRNYIIYKNIYARLLVF
jgi:cyclin E